MTSEKEKKHFFILYNNGDTFYFTIEPNLEIYCTKFKTIYEHTKKQIIPGAKTLEIIGNNFNLKNANEELIYSLDNYYKEIYKLAEIKNINHKIERIYIDEDVRQFLLSTGKIKYDASASQIPGLLYEPIDNSIEKTTNKESSYSKVKKKQNTY